MRKFAMFTGFFAMVISLAGIVLTALDGYHENINQLGGFAATAAIGLVLYIHSEMLSKKEREQRLEAVFVKIQREYLLEQFRKWDKELEMNEYTELVEYKGILFEKHTLN